MERCRQRGRLLSGAESPIASWTRDACDDPNWSQGMNALEHAS